jgi:hypothetical protein
MTAVRRRHEPEAGRLVDMRTCRRRSVIGVAVPLGGAMLAWVLLAVVDRAPAFTATFVGSSAQWLLTMTCMGGLITAGVRWGGAWSKATRSRAAARAAPLSLAIAAASLVLFAQTYSQRESDAAGSVGLAAVAALAVAVPAAIAAAAGTYDGSSPAPDSRSDA